MAKPASCDIYQFWRAEMYVRRVGVIPSDFSQGKSRGVSDRRFMTLIFKRDRSSPTAPCPSHTRNPEPP
jgi:hypothetical protein